ncbi:D-amino-acid transaminase [Paenibacillus sp. TRM 82003]|nr:D-amino-acid transaminase [Paenibacillus sp. TRM 82003]
MPYAWLNGTILEKSDVKIDLEDRGYQFGDGVYEVIRVYGGTVFQAEEHLRRLEASAAQIDIPLPATIDDIGADLERLVRSNRLSDGKIYMQVTRGAAPRNHLYPVGVPPVMTAYTEEVPRPVQLMKEGAQAITAEDDRWLRVNIKSLNLLPNVLARQRAKARGANEAIFLRDGIVTEGSASNIVGVKDSVCYTHPANHLILNGITRQTTEKLAGALGIDWVERPLALAELLAMDEVFMSNTVVEICPILVIDGVSIGEGTVGPITRRLQNAYEDLIKSSI